MRRSQFDVHDKASVTLSSMIHRNLTKTRARRVRSAAVGDLVSLHLEADPAAIAALQLGPGEEVTNLNGSYHSARLGADNARILLQQKNVLRLQSKKRKKPSVSRVLEDAGIAAGGTRVVGEDGSGVIVGIVDSGFDLSHPSFRDSKGKLRVIGLLDQSDSKPREYDTDDLEKAWASGNKNPGWDDDGHGTHVASIAASTKLGAWEGIAPGAKLLLVKTNYVDTDDAVSWIFRKAGKTPCVINMSLGHHMGAHDGTDAEERLHDKLCGPGKILVISAGNEQVDDIHVGGLYFRGQSSDFRFDISPGTDETDGHLIAFWDAQDDFEGSLITPRGRALPLPAIGPADFYETNTVQVELSRQRYKWSNSVKLQISISFEEGARRRDFERWTLALTCKKAVIGRVDAWLEASDGAYFHTHPWLDRWRTIALPATGHDCIAVASHVTRSGWISDDGDQEDREVVVGRASPFSSMGPTRDGRWKPEICAGGQYVTAALANDSESFRSSDRALSTERTLTIEGTSMAAPVVTGVIALMLQKNPKLDPEQVKAALRSSVKRDGHTGLGEWNPAYGHGKVDAKRALERL